MFVYVYCVFLVDEKASHLLSNVLDNIMLSDNNKGRGQSDRGGLKKIYSDIYKPTTATAQSSQGHSDDKKVKVNCKIYMLEFCYKIVLRFFLLKILRFSNIKRSSQVYCFVDVRCRCRKALECFYLIHKRALD